VNRLRIRVVRIRRKALDLRRERAMGWGKGLKRRFIAICLRRPTFRVGGRTDR